MNPGEIVDHFKRVHDRLLAVDWNARASAEEIASAQEMLESIHEGESNWCRLFREAFEDYLVGVDENGEPTDGLGCLILYRKEPSSSHQATTPPALDVGHF